MDGRGVPLSLVVTRANAHDVTQLDQVLNAILVKRRTLGTQRSKKSAAKRCDPDRKAQRRVVEVCHSWLNRLRKLPVRYEKLERSFVALNHIAAAIIACRKVTPKANIVYG